MREVFLNLLPLIMYFLANAVTDFKLLDAPEILFKESKLRSTIIITLNKNTSENTLLCNDRSGNLNLPRNQSQHLNAVPLVWKNKYINDCFDFINKSVRTTNDFHILKHIVTYGNSFQGMKGNLYFY